MRGPDTTGRFRDRTHAGRSLADLVARLPLDDPVVLALPRGGVPVADEIARRLNVGFDVYVARKIGAPYQPEYGVGAIAEDGEPVFASTAMRRLGLTPDDLAATVRAERAELARRVGLYRGNRELPELADRDVVLVDDRLATGVTARAALTALRERRPRRRGAGLVLGLITQRGRLPLLRLALPLEPLVVHDHARRFLRATFDLFHHAVGRRPEHQPASLA